MAKAIVADMSPNGASFNVFIPSKNGTSADIQHVTINGGGISNVLVATTEEWNSKVGLIGDKNVVYMYTDHHFNEEGQPVPAFKIGDGLAYLIDLPFNDDIAIAHIHNTSIHVTEQEKAFWNSKVTAYLNAEDLEELVLSSDYIPIQG